MNSQIGGKISVCLLTYNHVDLIESTLQSILDQTITGYEVIVSDDCSTDGTWERILELATNDTRIKPIQTPGNLGMAGNANFSVAQSSRPYIALLHHDDLYRNDLLEKWGEVMDKYQDVAFVFNPYGVYESDFIYSEAMPSERVDGRWFLNKYLFPRWGCVVRGTAMIRHSAWDKVGGLREQFGLLADIDLWMRLSMHWAVGYVSEPVITVRQARPDYYPDIYSDKEWSWKRRHYLYEIHAANRLEYFDLTSIIDKLRWWQFRFRLSIETAKFLSYGLVRNKLEMVLISRDSITSYDMVFLKVYRFILVKGVQLWMCLRSHK